MLLEEIKESLRTIKKKNLYPQIRVVDGISNEPEIVVGGKKVLLFCSGNYLGLANHPKIKQAIKEGLDKYGIHPAGSQLVSGTLDIHKRLEETISHFKNTQASMVFTTGTMANLGTIPALINLPNLSVYTFFSKTLRGENSAIFSDELNHGTIIDGIRLARTKAYIYKHRDTDDLASLLQHSKEQRKLIITDGVFSMDGDIAPLPTLTKLSKEYGAALMVDDAHSTGVLGKSGKGTLEHFGLTSGVDIQMGTFSKAFGVLGGFIAAESEIIEYLRIFARTYMFTGGFLGSLAAGVLKAFEIIQHDNTRRISLWDNTRYFKQKLMEIGFNTLNSETPIVPILIGEEHKSIQMAEELFENGIFAPSIRWPSVKKGESRIRFSLMATHTKEQINYLLNVLEGLKSRYKI